MVMLWNGGRYVLASHIYGQLLIKSPLQLYADHFPVLARIARDILAILGVSISIERLFSSSKHTLLDAQSSLSAESALKTVVAKEWLKKGFGEGVNYLDDVCTHC